jgi:hypothetical protein
MIIQGVYVANMGIDDGKYKEWFDANKMDVGITLFSKMV